MKMIQKFVDRFMAAKEGMIAGFKMKRPDSYAEIVASVISVIADSDDYGEPDKDRIHKIDDGDYQGTLVFVIGAQGYQPDEYWYTKVGYGSCSECDTLEGISCYSSDPITDSEAKQYWTLALHIVQRMKKMGDDELPHPPTTPVTEKEAKG
jgi:hypothetical protein